jgi:hypothetical protein
VRLLGPNAGEVDAAHFEAATADRSFSRDLDSGALTVDTEPSPGEPSGVPGPAQSQAAAGEALAPPPAQAAAQPPAADQAPQAERAGGIPAAAPAAPAAPRQVAGRPGDMPTYAAAVAGVRYALLQAAPEAAPVPAAVDAAATGAAAPQDGAPDAPLWPLAAGVALIAVACGLLVADRKPR